MRFRSQSLLALPLAMLLCIGAAASATEIPHVPRHEPRKIQVLVDDFRGRLSIPQDVTVAIVPTNLLLVSVRPEGSGVFVISVEQRFLDELSDEELQAVIAHELGHVWIFTNHPYLHTERLANRIAMRLVSRESLVKTYEKVHLRGVSKGDFARFLDEEENRTP